MLWLGFISIISEDNCVQIPDIITKEFITEPRRFYQLFSDDGFDVTDVQHVNDDCLYMSYKKYKKLGTRLEYKCRYCFPHQT